MCGRYELHTHPAAIALAFGLASPPALKPRYNIAPMTPVPIVRQNSAGERVLTEMRWGLVPRWAKDPSIGAKLINARGEGIADKPAFKMAFERRRCLLPADGFLRMEDGEGRQAAISRRKQERDAVGTRRTLRALARARRRGRRHLHGDHDRCE
jgi:putative SOS response-associated peptidase YedK